MDRVPKNALRLLLASVVLLTGQNLALATDFTAARAFNILGLPFNNGVSGGSQATGDFNGDGLTDVAINDFNGRRIIVLLGHAYGPPATYNLTFSPEAIAVGDFNKDGHQDLAVGGPNALGILLGNGDGTFQPPVHVINVGHGFTQGIAVADLNNDGNLDLVVADNFVTVLLGNGDGAFQAPVTYSTGFGFPNSVVIGDFNRDGRLDIAADNAVTTVVGFIGV